MKMYFVSRFAILTIALLSLFFSEMLAQSTTATKADFTINLEINNDVVTLTCTEGCDWKTLKVTPNNTSIDAKGKQSIAANAKDFMITVATNEKGIVLKGLKGTDWTELPLACQGVSCKLAINQSGLLQ